MGITMFFVNITKVYYKRSLLGILCHLLLMLPKKNDFIIRNCHEKEMSLNSKLIERIIPESFTEINAN